MRASRFEIVSPLAVYLDEIDAGTKLAPRPATLEGKVVGLLPNWRPSAYELLKAVGQVIEQRYRPKAVILEQPDHEVPVSKGKLLDGLGAKLDDFAARVDVAITATGD